MSSLIISSSNPRGMNSAAKTQRTTPMSKPPRPFSTTPTTNPSIIDSNLILFIVSGVAILFFILTIVAICCCLSGRKKRSRDFGRHLRKVRGEKKLCKNGGNHIQRAYLMITLLRENANMPFQWSCRDIRKVSIQSLVLTKINSFFPFPVSESMKSVLPGDVPEDLRTVPILPTGRTMTGTTKELTMRSPYSQSRELGAVTTGAGTTVPTSSKPGTYTHLL